MSAAPSVVPPAPSSEVPLCSTPRDDFDALTRRHWRGVFLAAYRLVRNSAEAEDVTQEAFARVFVRLPPAAIETESGFASYVRMAARRIIIDRRRALFGRDASRVFVPFDEEDEDGHPDGAANAHEQLEAHEMRERLLQTMTPRGRRVVELVIEGLLYREIAEELGIGAPSVCKLVAKARFHASERGAARGTSAADE